MQEITQETFYFYDLETSGLNPRDDRIMQFAGQRTDANFQPIGEPVNLLITLAEDTLPGPWAIMMTGITPTATRLDGISEREFCRFFLEEVATPGTTIMGYNSLRFDDEFMRSLLWRNFHDPYGWQWKDGRSRWDLLDVVRLTRALRPEGIEWPVRPDGKPTNKLELITKLNGIEHAHAHDALSDVEALISVTKLIREKQPQLFDYLYKMRGKRAVEDLVNLSHPQAFVYASGRYPSDEMHTTVAYPIAPAANGNVLVFDLRHDVEEVMAKMAEDGHGCAPVVKRLQYNHCPAVAPLGVLEKADGWKKLNLSEAVIKEHLAKLRKHPEFVEKMVELEKARAEKEYTSVDPESALYDGFLNESDARFCEVVRNGDANSLADFHPPFDDERLPELLLHYKGRNFPTALNASEAEQWEAYRRARLERQATKFMEEMGQIQKDLTAGKAIGARSADEAEYLVQELYLWFQSLQNGE